MPRSSTPWFRCERDQWYLTVDNRQHPLGVYGPGNHAAAVAAAKLLLAQLEGGPTPSLPPAPPPLTVPQAAAAVLAAKRGRVKPHTLYVYRQHLDRFAAAFPRTAVSALTADAVERSAVVPTWSDATRRGYLVAVGVCLKHAGYPLRFRKPPCRSAGARAVVSPEAFAHACEDAVGRGDLRALLVCLWHTGARPSELTGLRAADVDWPNATATLREHKTSGKGKARLLVFPPAVMAELERLRLAHPTGFLFRTERGRKWAKWWLSQTLTRMSRRIGVRVTAYGFRHGYICRALESGIPDTQVAALVGHGSTEMIHKFYSHLAENSRLLKDVATRLSQTPPAA
jgi:integrase